MTLTEALIRTDAALSAVIAMEVGRARRFLIEHGARPTEVETFIASYKAELAGWRSACLAEIEQDLRKWLAEQVEPPLGPGTVLH